MNTDDVLVKSFIIDSGILPKLDVDKIFHDSKISGRDFESMLIDAGMMTRDNLRRVHAYILGIPFVNLKIRSIKRDVLALIPEPIVREFDIVAYERKGDFLEVAVLDIGVIKDVDFIKDKIHLTILPRLTDEASMRMAKMIYQKNLHDEFGTIIKTEAGKLQNILTNSGLSNPTLNLSKIVSDDSLANLTRTILSHAHSQNASDIHIESLDAGLVVRYRIGGAMREAMVLAKNIAPFVMAKFKQLAGLNIEESSMPQEGLYRCEVSGKSVALRISTLPLFDREKLVIRIFPESSAGFTLESIGFHGYGLEVLHRAFSKGSGLILVAGEKSEDAVPVLYTFLDIVSRSNVVTTSLEDDIRFPITGVNQVLINQSKGLDAEKGLRSIIRSDANVIMLSSIQSDSVATLCAHCALTSRLILSRIDVKRASDIAGALLKMRVEPIALVSASSVFVTCKLVRRLNGEKVAYYLTDVERDELRKVVDLDKVLDSLKSEEVVAQSASWDKIPFYQPKPGREYESWQGQLGLFEVMPITDAIKDVILKGGDSADIDFAARKSGMLSLLEDGVFKAVAGLTTLEEVLGATL